MDNENTTPWHIAVDDEAVRAAWAGIKGLYAEIRHVGEKPTAAHHEAMIMAFAQMEAALGAAFARHVLRDVEIHNGSIGQ